MAADQEIIDYGTEPNDGTGDPLRDAFIKVDTNFSAIWNAGPVGSNIVISNNTIGVSDTNGNLILAPNGIGVVQNNNHFVPRINNVYNLGTANLNFRTAYIGVGGITTTGGITATGNVATSGYFIGDGSQLSNLTVTAGTEITNGTSNVKVYNNGNVSVGVGGVSNVAVFSNSVLTVSGNISANYIAGNGSSLTSTMADRSSDTSNWNTLTQMGVYQVNRASWSGVTGAPLDSSVFVGILQVSTSGSATAQLFIPGTVTSGNAAIQWNRSLSAGTWTSWYKMINNGQIIDAGIY